MRRLALLRILLSCSLTRLLGCGLHLLLSVRLLAIGRRLCVRLLRSALLLAGLRNARFLRVGLLLRIRLLAFCLLGSLARHLLLRSGIGLGLRGVGLIALPLRLLGIRGL